MSDKNKLRKINELLDNNSIEEAKKICIKNSKNKKFISCYIKILFMENNLEEAEKLCLKNLDYPFIASEYISLLIKSNKYEEAKKFCESYRDIDQIAAQYLIVLDALGENEKVEEVANTYPYNVYVAKAYIHHLVKFKEYDKAIEICERFPLCEDINNLYDKILIEKQPDNMIELKNDLSVIQNKVHELIKDKKYEEAKFFLKPYIDNSNMFDLYMVVLEEKRIHKRLFKNLEQ